jgi:hypothetical protein
MRESGEEDSGCVYLDSAGWRGTKFCESVIEANV